VRLSTFAAIAALVSSGALRAQQPITSRRPLEQVSTELGSRGTVVSYEDPVLSWGEDLEAIQGTSGLAGFPKERSFALPAAAKLEKNPFAKLRKIVEAYDQQTSLQQTSGTQFQVLSSKLGYHIVPLEGSLLDSRIEIARGDREALEHLTAFAAAVQSSTGVKFRFVRGAGKTMGFNQLFGISPANTSFAWGTQPAVARDVLIDLLRRSSKSLSWRLYCQAAPQAADRSCILNIVHVGT
jgi:hypothetical protein